MLPSGFHTIPYHTNHRTPCSNYSLFLDASSMPDPGSRLQSSHLTKPNQTKPTQPAPHRRQQQQRRATLLKCPWPYPHRILGPSLPNLPT
jgi:hypothetical protein